MSQSINSQWIAFVKSGYQYSKFTVELYEFLFIRGGFIAHFNRAGFYKARFHTTADLDVTIGIMQKHKELAKVLAFDSHEHMDAYINARLRIARLECSVLEQQAKIMIERAAAIRAEYKEGVI